MRWFASVGHVSFWWLALDVMNPIHRARALNVSRSSQCKQAEGFSEVSRCPTLTELIRSKALQEFLKKSCKPPSAWLSVKYLQASDPKSPRKNRNDNQLKTTATSQRQLGNKYLCWLRMTVHFEINLGFLKDMHFLSKKNVIRSREML